MILVLDTLNGVAMMQKNREIVKNSPKTFPWCADNVSMLDMYVQGVAERGRCRLYVPHEDCV